MSDIKTLSPEAGLGQDISVSDLGKILSGETVAAPVITPAVPVTPAPIVPIVATPEPTEAIAIPPAVEPAKTIETESEGSVDPIQEPDKPKKDKEKWWDKRLSHSAEKRREAEARADTETKRAEQLTRELEALRAQPGPVKPAAVETTPAPATGKPVLADYVAALKDGEAYEVAVERYSDASSDYREKARDLKQQAKADAAKATTQAEAKQAQQATFAKDWAAATELHPDFPDVVERVRAVAPEGLQIAVSQIQDTEGKALWPDLLMYLDEHPAELAKLGTQFAANPYAAAAQLGRIAASFSTPAPKLTTQTPPKISPKPPTAVGGTSAPGVVDLNDAKTSMDIAAREFTRLGL